MTDTEDQKPRPERIEKLIENTKDTRFGGPRANPRYTELPGSPTPWSSRHAIRYFAAQEADPDDKNALKNILTHNGKKKPTLAETAAMAQIKRAINGKSSDFVAMTEAIEGKLALPIRNEGDNTPLEKPTFNIFVSDEVRSKIGELKNE